MVEAETETFVKMVAILLLSAEVIGFMNYNTTGCEDFIVVTKTMYNVIGKKCFWIKKKLLLF